ncbi:MAG: dihydrofolate reductase [Candidatus Woesearchaeota archaeon]|nr:dihydrofolate reductase [Candidatus Woesearchaeota archaeon]
MNKTPNQSVKIILIAAIDQNNVIGSEGHLPWHIPEDFSHFKQTTDGHTVIMGRKTYESIGKPLPNRLNIVLTRNKAFAPTSGVVACTTLRQALAVAQEKGTKVFIIGGAQVYAETMPYAHEMILSHIPGTHKGDVFFPAWGKEWNMTKEDTREKFTIRTYEHDKPALLE